MDVDDLVAIAVVFNVSPLALLLPTFDGPVVPQGISYTAEDIWNWAKGGFPLSDPTTGVVETAEWLAYMEPSNPFTDFSEAFDKFKSMGFVQGKDRSARGDD